MDDLTGQRLDGYELLRLLGRGAMASVYLAEQASLGRRVAVKVLGAELCRDEAYVARFQHEARSAASLTHPGIVQVYEVGCAAIDGVSRHYIAQEYVAGGTLGRLLSREGALPPGRVLGVLWQVASALASGAQSGLVHRDIKPDNLMVDRSGSVKVADFGLARVDSNEATRLTQAGVALGTPLYMSPEQIEGRELDTRSDLYSLGVTAYQLLTGEPPFHGDAPLAVAVQHLNQPPEPIAERRTGVPAALSGVIERLLAKAPEDRYESPTELLSVLRDAAREAEVDGWADPSFDLTSSTLGTGGLSLSGAVGAEAVQRLGEAMREDSSTKREAAQRKRRFLIKSAGAVAVGALLALVLRPAPLVAIGPNKPIRHAEDVKSQLYLAKLSDTPQAWLAVSEYFPEADPFYRLLALRGYAVSTLRLGRDREALRALEQLVSLAGDDAEFNEFGNAGMVLVNRRMGREQAARVARGRLRTAEPASFLKMAPELSAELREAVRELDRSGS